MWIKGEQVIVDPVLGDRYPTPARVRARSLQPPKLTTVEEREDFLELLMLEGVWTDHTSRECQFVCAEAWEVAMSTVPRLFGGGKPTPSRRARESGGRMRSKRSRRYRQSLNSDARRASPATSRRQCRRRKSS